MKNLFKVMLVLAAIVMLGRVETVYAGDETVSSKEFNKMIQEAIDSETNFTKGMKSVSKLTNEQAAVIVAVAMEETEADDPTFEIFKQKRVYINAKKNKAVSDMSAVTKENRLAVYKAYCYGIMTGTRNEGKETIKFNPASKLTLTEATEICKRLADEMNRPYVDLDGYVLYAASKAIRVGDYMGENKTLKDITGLVEGSTWEEMRQTKATDENGFAVVPLKKIKVNYKGERLPVTEKEFKKIYEKSDMTPTFENLRSEAIRRGRYFPEVFRLKGKTPIEGELLLQNYFYSIVYAKYNKDSYNRDLEPTAIELYVMGEDREKYSDHYWNNIVSFYPEVLLLNADEWPYRVSRSLIKSFSYTRQNPSEAVQEILDEINFEQYPDQLSKFMAYREWCWKSFKIENNPYDDDMTIDVYDGQTVAVTRQAACQGFAEFTDIIFEYAGITSWLVISREIDHAWNAALIDGRIIEFDLYTVWFETEKAFYGTDAAWYYDDCIPIVKAVQPALDASDLFKSLGFDYKFFKKNLQPKLRDVPY